MKLKKSAIEAVEEAAPAAGGGAFISARLRNPAEEVAAEKTAKGGGDVVGGICAIVALILIAITAVLLYADWNSIQSA